MKNKISPFKPQKKLVLEYTPFNRREIREGIENAIKEYKTTSTKKAFLTREMKNNRIRWEECKQSKSGFYLGVSAMLVELECERWNEELKAKYKKL